MRHEPDYRSGQYINRELGLYLGWVCRPAIPSDCLPVISRNNDVVLIFHGENYPTDEGSSGTTSASRPGQPWDAHHLLVASLLTFEEEESFCLMIDME